MPVLLGAHALRFHANVTLNDGDGVIARMGLAVNYGNQWQTTQPARPAASMPTASPTSMGPQRAICYLDPYGGRFHHIIPRRRSQR
ncbi:hypothetical protein ATN84_16655 [Paramesorhizobium deserti]|uniref:Uncharacterized protein n=1 Tax=Paramesorhizobium deserti TaxID=1494590 RepID=A0A135HQY8_9HYPH|nr:hypothetical protein ATN84_16655 [Paramesorhizobium deserti]